MERMRSMEQFVREDIVSVHYRILKLMVPDLVEPDFAGFEKAIVWLKTDNNVGIFARSETDKTSKYILPPEINDFKYSLNTFLELGRQILKEKSNGGKALYEAPVTFTARNLETDMLPVVQPFKEKFIGSQKDGSLSRAEAIDTFFSEALNVYWQKLHGRGKIFVSAGREPLSL